MKKKTLIKLSIAVAVGVGLVALGLDPEKVWSIIVNIVG